MVLARTVAAFQLLISNMRVRSRLLRLCSTFLVPGSLSAVARTDLTLFHSRYGSKQDMTLTRYWSRACDGCLAF